MHVSHTCTYIYIYHTEGILYVHALHTHDMHAKTTQANTLNGPNTPRCRHSGGYVSGQSVQLAVEDVPSAPQVALSVVNATSIQVSWTAPQSTHALKYQVSYQPADSSGSATTVDVAVGSSTVLVITGLTTEQLMRVNVRASNLYGWSAFGTGTIASFAAPFTPPASVTALLHPSWPQSVINITWTSVEFATSYRLFIQQYVVNLGDWGALMEQQEPYTQTAAVVRGLTSETMYRFRVFSANQAGSDPLGQYSNNLTTNAVQQPTVAVQNLTCTSTTSSSLLITWTQGSDQLSITEAFRVEVSTAVNFAGGSTRTLPEVVRNTLASGLEALFVNVTALTTLTRYYVRVTPRSANILGYVGVPSATVSAIPVPPPTQAVTNLQVMRFVKIHIHAISAHAAPAAPAAALFPGIIVSILYPTDTNTRILSDDDESCFPCKSTAAMSINTKYWYT